MLRHIGQKGRELRCLEKTWLTERFAEGFVFKKLDVRGKVFIEYGPAEKAWCPIVADGYMHIDCFWVSGQFKGQGHANRLLEGCIADAKAGGKVGLTALSSAKKMPFLSDPGYLKYRGFMVTDTAKPYYELLYLPFDRNAVVPKFRDCAKMGRTDEPGMVLYYSDHCPHAEKYAYIVRTVAEKRGKTLRLLKIATTEQARNTPTPFTTYSLFCDGAFVTNEILSEKKFEKFLDTRV